MGRVPGDTQNTAAILEGDTHITRDLGTGVPKTRGNPNHCDSAIVPAERREKSRGKKGDWERAALFSRRSAVAPAMPELLSERLEQANRD